MSEEFRKSPPAPLAPRPFNIPRPFDTTLANGLRVVIAEDSRLPLVSLRLVVLAGDAYDDPDEIGLNSAMASMLTEGTENYSSRELAEEVERLGATLVASSGSDNTRISASCLSIYFSELLGLMQEVVLRPTFHAGELDLYKSNTIEGLKFQRSQASFLAGERVAKIIFGEHPYSIISPVPADIEKIDREAVVSHHQKRLIPNNSVLVVVGDIGRDAALAEIEGRFGGWESGEMPRNEFPALPERSQRTLTIVDRKGSAQSNIVLALPGLGRSHPDFFPVVVMNQILGAGASSRIFMNLREEKGYTYGAYSKFDMKRLGGEFEATAEVRAPVTGDSLREFFFELDRIRDEKVSDEELRDAVNYLTGVFPIRAETQEGLTNLIVQQKIYGLPDDYLETYREHISAVTADEVSRVARAYVKPELVAIVIVGDGTAILEQAAPYAAAVDAFDSDGNEIEVASLVGSAPAADCAGRWELTADFQGQRIPFALELKQESASVTGRLESMLGEGTIDNGRIAGSELSAVAAVAAQGRSVEIGINAGIEGDSMNGSLTLPMFPEPLAFSGSRN